MLLEGIPHACILLEGMLDACMLLDDMLDALPLPLPLPLLLEAMTSPVGPSETSLTGPGGGTEVEDGGVGWLTSKSLLGQGSPGLLT